MSKLKTNEVVLISPNGLVEKTLTLGDDGVVKIDGKEKANVVQEDWQYPTLLNGWVNFDSSYTPVRFMKDSMGFVHLEGMVKNGTTTIGTPLFILPVGYRPSQAMIFAGLTSPYAPCGFDLSADGVFALSNGNAAYLGFYGITFKAVS